MSSLQPAELAAWLREGRSVRLLDVREAAEWAIARLPGAEWKPLSEAPSWLRALAEEADERPLVVYCHHGVRSARVCGALQALGRGAVWNLAGGIERWALEVDPATPRY